MNPTKDTKLAELEEHRVTVLEETKIARFLKQHQLQLVKFDGCAYGLRSCIKGEEEKYLKKPWMIATNIPEVVSTLDGNYCPGIGPGHTHSVTCGKNAKHSQQYTAKLAEDIHRAIANFTTNGKGCWMGLDSGPSRPL